MMLPLVRDEVPPHPPHRSELDKFALSRSMKNRPPTSCLVTRTRRILQERPGAGTATATNRNYND